MLSVHVPNVTDCLCVCFTVSIDGVQSDQTALRVRFDWITDNQWVGYRLVFRHGYTTR